MKILFASTSGHKLQEFQRLFAHSGLDLTPPRDWGLPALDVAETSNSFTGNAIIKARAYQEAYRIPVLADDSGLCVDALAGAPGIRSHRFGPPNLDDAGRVHYMLGQLSTIGDPFRGAHYVCALVFLLPDGGFITSEGYCYGHITRHVHTGSTGFGYDPIFRPGGHDRTFAEMTPEEKDRLSHRGHAARRLHARAVRLGAVSGTL
jgi:XTP/dITP diphosphohydrolase